jgi:hypothetical protein
MRHAARRTIRVGGSKAAARADHLVQRARGQTQVGGADRIPQPCGRADLAGQWRSPASALERRASGVRRNSTTTFAAIRDTTLAHELALTVGAVRAKRPLDSTSLHRALHPLHLSADLVADSSGALWPLFRLFAPLPRNAEVAQRPRFEYPQEYSGWSAKVRLLCNIDVDGKAEVESLRATPPPDSIEFNDAKKAVGSIAVYEGIMLRTSLMPSTGAEANVHKRPHGQNAGRQRTA